MQQRIVELINLRAQAASPASRRMPARRRRAPVFRLYFQVEQATGSVPWRTERARPVETSKDDSGRGGAIPPQELDNENQRGGGRGDAPGAAGALAEIRGGEPGGGCPHPPSGPRPPPN